MRFALLAFTTRMVSGYNRGGVTIHAPSGDGNSISAGKLGKLIRYNPRPVRGRKFTAVGAAIGFVLLQSTPRQGTEI